MEDFDTVNSLELTLVGCLLFPPAAAANLCSSKPLTLDFELGFFTRIGTCRTRARDYLLAALSVSRKCKHSTLQMLEIPRLVKVQPHSLRCLIAAMRHPHSVRGSWRYCMRFCSLLRNDCPVTRQRSTVIKNASKGCLLLDLRRIVHTVCPRQRGNKLAIGEHSQLALHYMVV